MRTAEGKESQSLTGSEQESKRRKVTETHITQVVSRVWSTMQKRNNKASRDIFDDEHFGSMQTKCCKYIVLCLHCMSLSIKAFSIKDDTNIHSP